MSTESELLQLVADSRLTGYLAVILRDIGSSQFSLASAGYKSIIKGCYAYNVPRFLTFYAAAPLIVTLIMFLMTLYKCVLTLYRMDHRVMPLWKLFLRDGVVWFILVFAAGGSELLIWTMRRETLKQVLLVPALVVYSGVSSRTLLNIKQIMASDPPETSELDATSGSIIFTSS
ncbi:hypothetical protein C8R47DRAFT_1212152 [Mycena vitilis]|nr:hypothetical protein C8R47DRAFT_1212152 [Mycena vitilis]